MFCTWRSLQCENICRKAKLGISVSNIVLFLLPHRVRDYNYITGNGIPYSRNIYIPKLKKVALTDWRLVHSVQPFIIPGAFRGTTIAWRYCGYDGRRESKYACAILPISKLARYLVCVEPHGLDFILLSPRGYSQYSTAHAGETPR